MKNKTAKIVLKFSFSINFDVASANKLINNYVKSQSQAPYILASTSSTFRHLTTFTLYIHDDDKTIPSIIIRAPPPPPPSQLSIPVVFDYCWCIAFDDNNDVDARLWYY